MFTEDSFNVRCGTVPGPDPNNLGWETEQETALAEVGILRNNDEIFLAGIIPHSLVIRMLKPEPAHMTGAGKKGGKRFYQSGGKVLIEEKLHSEIVSSFRSRSAAKARQALMSSEVRSGKSFRISSSVMPEAKYSRTS